MTKSRGVRALTASTLVNTTGDGLYIAASALFFTRGLRLPVAQVGLGLTLAGLVGLSAGVYVGRLADRYGPRGVLIGIQLLQTAAIGSYVLVGRSLLAFTVVASVVIACMQGADAAQGALVGQLGEGDPVKLRAYLHSVANVGISVGTLLAGIAIAADTHRAYQLVMLADAGSFLGAAASLLLVPPVASRAEVSAGRAESRRRSLALRDGRYIALTATNCVMSLQYFVLAFAMPLWVIGHTSAPRWLVSPLLLTNTLLIVVLQVRFSRGTSTPEGGARSVARAGVVLAAAMVFYSAAAGRVAGAAVVLLVAAAVAHTAGELLQSAGSYGISYGLASEHALGEYLGVYGLGIGLCRAIAPGVLTLTCLEHGTLGWLLLAGLFVLSGLVTLPLATRQPSASIGKSETVAGPAPVCGTSL